MSMWKILDGPNFDQYLYQRIDLRSVLLHRRPIEKKLFLCLSISKKLFCIKIGVVDHLRIIPINTSQPPAVKDNFDFESTWPRFVAHFGAYCLKSEKKSLKK